MEQNEGNVFRVQVNNGEIVKPVETQEEVENAADISADDLKTDPPVAEEVELDEGSILKFFEKKGKQVSSIDELFSDPEPKVIEKEVELPDNVKSFYEFHKETGGSIEDYVSLNKDYSSMDEMSVLASYYALKHPNLSRQDVLDFIDAKFGVNEEEMDETEIRRRNLDKKVAFGEAVDELNRRKEKYKADLASRKADIPDNEEFNEFKSYKEQQKNNSERLQILQETFTKQRSELFGDKFEGFKFDIGASEPLIYKPENHKSLASDEMQSAKFITSQYFDENGVIKDVEGFHKLIYMARNQNSILKAAYEKGAADAIKNHEKESKNIDMANTVPVVNAGEGIKIRVIEGTGGSKPMIKAR